jgi:hypothetical protein
MTTAAIRKKLTDYLKVADDQKVKAIYTMVKDEINTEANNWDEELVKELGRRSKTFADGSAKMYSWQETKQAAMNKVKAKKK